MEPRSNDFLSYECAIHIDAPAARVFEVVGDLGSSTDWAGSGHIRSINKVTDGPIGVGTRYRSSEKITMSYGATSEIVAYAPDEHIIWISKPVGERVPYHRWAFWLEPEAGGTRLRHAVRAARSKGPMGLVQRLGFLFTKPAITVPPGMDRTLQNVKRLVEGAPDGAARRNDV
jgi:uncharacterized protein YndB with AHSA1/START domain